MLMLSRLLLVLLLPLVTSGPVAAAKTYPPCAAGRYIVRGAALIIGPGQPLATDAVSYAPQGVAIDSGCATATPIRVRGTKNGTRVKVKWGTCQNIFGSAILTGRIDASCKTMTGILKAKRAKLRKPFTATLSFCGDAVYDPALEQCEDTSGCNGGTCLDDCTCSGGVTTTTTTIGGGSTSTTASTGGSTTTHTTTTSTTSTTSNDKADLVPTAFTSNVTTIVVGQQMNVSFTVKNQGALAAAGAWYDQVVLSTDQFFSQSDTALLSPYHTGPLAVAGTYSMNGQQITIPANLSAGTYYLLFKTDSYGYVTENDEGNNEWSPAIAITVQVPDLIPTAFSSSVSSIVSGQQLNVSWTVKNQGAGTAFGQWYDQVVLSTDQFFSQDDVNLAQPVHSGPLLANATYSANNQQLTIPSTQAAGTYYLLLRTDAYSGVFEDGNDANNEWGTPIPITVQTPDLIPTAFSASTMTIVSGQQLNVSWTVKNQGTGTAFGQWYDQVVLSTDPFFSADDPILAQPTHSGPLLANGTYSVNNSQVTISGSQTAGSYYLLLRTDAYSGLFENGDDANNVWAMPISISVQAPDLIPTAFSASTTTITSGQSLNVSWTVKNQGAGTGFGQWYDQVVLSTDQFFSANDPILAQPTHAGPLLPNGTYSVNNTQVTISGTQPAGTYYLLFRTDAYAGLFEDGNDGNNEWGTPIQITVQSPDLIPTAFSASGTIVTSGQQLNVSWTVKNQGSGTAFGQWYDQVVLSTDQFFSANDPILAQPTHAGPLLPNGTYSANNTQVTISGTQPAGTYYLLFRTDAYAGLFEDGNDGNNEWGTPIQITVQAPDLAPTAFSASTATVTHGAAMTVSWTVKNQGTGTAFGQWYDQVVLSTDQFFSANDPILSQPTHAGPLAPNGTYSVSGQSVTIPAATPAGSYYLLMRTDAYAGLFEDTNEGNNEWSAPIAITVN